MKYSNNRERFNLQSGETFINGMFRMAIQSGYEDEDVFMKVLKSEVTFEKVGEEEGINEVIFRDKLNGKIIGLLEVENYGVPKTNS
ncbi:MAG: hypothetical protein SLAVMIC_01024 [uncultured marine phage]|uniref:Uncharacterized protein n=1 Tax=uncultured marine phage TaxID=707152 RepID=A0A8D9C9W6_9VIRU|nr:MAG: hypothetical protein SLAVMIC_01024 [uncultured marine phage]